MIRLLLSIVMNRRLTGDPQFIQCGQCGAIASDLGGARMRTITHIRIVNGRVVDGTTTPPEWECSSCGRSGPLVVGELLANDTWVACRRTFLCRYAWTVPASLTTMTCPRCYTRQPGPAHPR